ncbi:MAG: FG-GAP repeat protein [Planctomycetes bacterium]|nr:FG-GAP repeat protein [Planctomycetota bacterium]
MFNPTVRRAEEQKSSRANKYQLSWILIFSIGGIAMGRMASGQTPPAPHAANAPYLVTSSPTGNDNGRIVSYDILLNASQSQSFGSFGCWMVAGSAYPDSSHVSTDVVIAAPHEAHPDVLGTSDVGHAYVYRGRDSSGDSYQFGHHAIQLIPGTTQTGQAVGNLGLAVAKLGGSNALPLILVSSWTRDIPLDATNVARGLGAVDGYVMDITNLSGGKTSVFGSYGIFPPPDKWVALEPGSPPIPKQQDNQFFGFSIAVGDIDGDGCNDLAVTAGGADIGDGRVYIFWGEPNATYPNGLDASNPTVTVIMAPTAGLGTAFGSWVSIANLNSAIDSFADLVVGEPHWPDANSKYGRGHLYSGAELKVYKPTYHGGVYLYGDTNNDGIPDANAPTTFNTPFTDYGEEFAFYHWLIDVDDPQDGLPDIIFHSEGAPWPGSNNGGIGGAAGVVPTVGSLYIYKNRSDQMPTGWPTYKPYFQTTPDHILFSGTLESGARFGRNVVFTNWKDDTLGVSKPALIVSEPDASYSPSHTLKIEDTGLASLYFCSQVQATTSSRTSLTPSWRIPSSRYGETGTSSYLRYLDFQTLPNTEWGPKRQTLWSRCMATGNFDNTVSAAKAQVVIGASARNAPKPSDATAPLSQAGAAAHVKEQ